MHTQEPLPPHYPDHASRPTPKECWSSPLPEPLRAQALETLSQIEGHLCRPEQVLSMVDLAKTQSEEFFWSSASLSNSFASLALFFLFLSRSFPEREKVAHEYLRLAAQATRQHSLIHPGLFTGSTGFLFILSLFCQVEPRYQKLLDHSLLDTINQVREVVGPHCCNLYKNSNADYEVISGIAGILTALLSLPSRTGLLEDTIQQLLKYLLWLSEADEQGREHWFVLPEYLPVVGPYRKMYPGGYFNLGLSHGIPGPLAALALAWQKGYRVAGQCAAIERLSRWLMDHQITDQWGVNWPYTIPLESAFRRELWSTLPTARTAWCYGAPGILSALWLAGQATEDKSLQQFAMEGFAAALSRPVEQQDAYSPTICHGAGGLLAIGLRFAHRSTDQHLYPHLAALTTRILDACNPDFPGGVRDEALPGRFVDDPGFLTGAAGVGLVLLAATTSVEPRWDRALLLS